MRAFIYLPALRASSFPKIQAVPSMSGQSMGYWRWDETRLSSDMGRYLQQNILEYVALMYQAQR